MKQYYNIDSTTVNTNLNWWIPDFWTITRYQYISTPTKKPTTKTTTTGKTSDSLGGSQIATTETEQLQQLCSLWYRNATGEGGGGQLFRWILKKTKEEPPQKVRHLYINIYIYNTTFFWGGCFVVSFFFKTLEVPTCEGFQAWFLVCDLFLVTSFDDFPRIIFTDLAKIPLLQVQRQEDPSAEARDCTKKVHEKRMWNWLKSYETEPIYDTWHDISEFMSNSWCVWADCPHLP